MSAMSSGNETVQNALLKLCSDTYDDKSHKRMIREQMLKLEQDRIKLEEDRIQLEEDRIMAMDTSSMAPDQVAYFQMRRAHIIKRRLGESSSH